MALFPNNPSDTRWRCQRCETLNSQDKKLCFVCDLEKFQQRKCLKCGKNIVSDGQEYCMECYNVVVEESTKGLKRANLMLSIGDIALVVGLAVLGILTIIGR